MKIFKKHSRCLLAAAIATSALGLSAACGSASTTSSPTGAITASAASTAVAPTLETFPNYAKFGPPNFKLSDTTKRIALLLPATDLPIQQSILQGFEQVKNRYHVKLTVFNAGGYQNASLQLSQMETAISQKPTAIVVVPVSPVALNAGIAQAKAAGIPVLGALLAPSSADVSFSLVSNLQSEGVDLVDALAAKLHDKGNIYMVFGGAGSTLDSVAGQAAVTELKRYPHMKLVYRQDFASFSASDALTAVENGLVAHPNVQGVLTNSTSLVYGANSAFREAGKSIVPGVGAFNGTLQDIRELETNKIAAAISAPYAVTGDLLTRWALSIAAGNKPKKKSIVLPSTALTPQNIRSAISSGNLYKISTPKSLGCGPGQPKSC